jgi:DNA (cytosine-5)-methyltransferase 1
MTYPELLTQAWQQHLAPRRRGAPTVVSLFAGCGGSSLGYSMAGYRELLAVEWDENAAATFRLNFPGVPVYCGDIAKLTVEEAMRLAGIGPGELDVLDGSPPCQGFSMAGRRKMSDSRNQLFHEFTRLLRDLQPRAFVMENVSGMVKGKMKLIFVEILKELKACGYQVSARLMNAMYFNVPQSRARLIFIGSREGAPSHPAAAARPFGPRIEPGATELFLSPAQDANARKHKARHVAKGQGYGYQLLSESKPAPTWPTTKILHTSPLWLDAGRLRAPSQLELKWIGSYPPEFAFLDYDSAWERIGNSVPPLFMRAIAEHVRTRVLAPRSGATSRRAKGVVV